MSELCAAEEPPTSEESTTDDESRTDEEPRTVDASPADDEAETRDAVAAHLADLEDGAGCTEIWEHLSTRRDDA